MDKKLIATVATVAVGVLVALWAANNVAPVGAIVNKR